jgi:hypothetical protein
MAGRSPAGGWTKKQLAIWGVPWPPPKGWKRKLTGTNFHKVQKPRQARPEDPPEIHKYPFYARINGSYVYVTRTRIVR